MNCDRYLELLSARLDGALTEAEERELEEHLAACPDCRAAGAQLAALRGAFPELEEDVPPEGFARGVMDRIRAAETPKVIPLFKRPQVRALAGLAACFVLVVGIYGISQLRNQEKMMLVTRSFQHDVLEETVYGADVSAGESLDGEADGPQVNAALVDPELADAPQTAAYAAPNPTQADTSAGTAGSAPEASTDGVTAQKAAPSSSTDYGCWRKDVEILVLDRMPEGAWELIPPETPVSLDSVYVTAELLEQIKQLAEEQGIEATVTTGTGESERHMIVISDGIE